MIFTVIVSSNVSDRYTVGDVLICGRDFGSELVGRCRTVRSDAAARLCTIETFYTLAAAVNRAQELQMDDYDTEVSA